MNMPADYPRLSIVVNNYNYGAYLEEALDSALKQMRDCDELVAVDDGSTDNSREILQRYQREHGIRVIEQQNRGQMHAVRTGIFVAKGDVVLLMDSDDYYLDGYLSRLRHIYRQGKDVSFVFAQPEVGGAYSARANETRNILDHMAFPGGFVGPTRWATQLFSEYVGVPTSGVSLQKKLADKILSLPESIDVTDRIGEIRRRFFGISAHEANNFGFAADAIIVRGASVLGANKYYDDQKGFMYRIHGTNKYAAVPRRGRWYMRKVRKAQIAKLFCDGFDLERKPTTTQLYNEFRERSLPLRLRRRARLRLNYSIAVCGSRGDFRQKLYALLLVVAGIGSKPRQPAKQ